MRTQIKEQNNNDKIGKTRDEMEKKFEAIFKGLRSHKSAATITNPGHETHETQNTQPSRSKNDKFIGVHASNNKNSVSEIENYLLRVSELKDLRHPDKPLYRSELNVDTRFRGRGLSQS